MIVVAVRVAVPVAVRASPVRNEIVVGPSRAFNDGGHGSCAACFGPP